MSSTVYLRRLIAAAVAVWGIDPPDVSAKASGACKAARTAIAVIAYEQGCSGVEIASAFGWPELKESYRPGEAFRHHSLLLRNSDYRERLGTLRRQAPQ